MELLHEQSNDLMLILELKNEMLIMHDLHWLEEQKRNDEQIEYINHD